MQDYVGSATLLITALALLVPRLEEEGRRLIEEVNERLARSKNIKLANDDKRKMRSIMWKLSICFALILASALAMLPNLWEVCKYTVENILAGTYIYSIDATVFFIVFLVTLFISSFPFVSMRRLRMLSIELKKRGE